MRTLLQPSGRLTRRPFNKKVLAFLSIITAAMLLAGVPFGGDAGQAQAGYTQMQSKLAGRYEGYRQRRAEQRQAYKAQKTKRRPAKKTYQKSRKKKAYKKYRNGKRRYSGKKRYSGKTAKYRKSKRSKSSKRYAYKKKYKKVASLSPSYQPNSRKSLSGSGVRWVASAGCLNGTLKSIVYQVASKFGPVTVSSTCRSKKRNARAGGAKRSQHLSGSAVDFRVHANHRAAYAYLKSHGSVGGYKHYGGGLFHIDVGPRRTW